MRLLVGIAAAVAGLASPGEAFLQLTPGNGLATAVHRGPLILRAPPVGRRPAKPEPELHRRSFPLFATIACAALMLRAKVARRAKGRPQATSGLRIRRPLNNAMRNSSVPTYEEVTRKTRYEPLVYMYRRRFARPKGKPIRLAIKGRKSGHKHSDNGKKYRVIDFARTKRGVYGTIESVEYDPYRCARICLVRYDDGEKRYILHALGFYVGQQVLSADDAPIFVGNAMPLSNVPIGTMVHNIAQYFNSPGAIARKPGTSCIVLNQSDDYTTVKMPSAEVRMFPKGNWCTIGKVGRIEHGMRKMGKAGIMHYYGKRPHVRGMAKNSCDHKQGGGEGRSRVGYKYPRTRYGKCAFMNTRRTGRHSDKFILIRSGNRSTRKNV